MSVFHYKLSTQVVEIYRLLTIVEANAAWNPVVNPDLPEQVHEITERIRAPEISRIVLSLAAASRTTIHALERELDRSIESLQAEGGINTRHVDLADTEKVEYVLRRQEQLKEKEQKYWAALKERLLEIKQRKVGSFKRDSLNASSPTKRLRFDTACDKVLHADQMIMAYSQMGPSEANLIRLAGYHNGKQWSVVLDLREFALAAFDVVLTEPGDRSWYDG
jgi:hypothetical protein